MSDAVMCDVWPNIAVTYDDLLVQHVLDFHYPDTAIVLAGTSVAEVEAQHRQAHETASEMRPHAHTTPQLGANKVVAIGPHRIYGTNQKEG